MSFAQLLQNKVAVITGASRGIGAATAVRLGAMGAQCILVGRTVGGLEATDDAIRQSGGVKAVIVPLDLQSDHDKIDALGAELFTRYGRLDILIGNAAQLGVLSPLGHIEPKTWDETFALNVTANFRLLRSFDPLLRLSQAGRALFVTCAIARNPEPFWGVYAASKAALETMVECYVAEMRETTVRAQCFDPDVTGTYLYRKAFPGLKQVQMQTPEQAAEKIILALAF